jgi:hypothetical protein
MARKTGQIIRRGPTTWLVRIYVGRDSETRRRIYLGKSIQGGCVPPRLTSIACSASGISDATSARRSKA